METNSRVVVGRRCRPGGVLAEGTADTDRRTVSDGEPRTRLMIAGELVELCKSLGSDSFINLLSTRRTAPRSPASAASARQGEWRSSPTSTEFGFPSDGHPYGRAMRCVAEIVDILRSRPFCHGRRICSSPAAEDGGGAINVTEGPVPRPLGHEDACQVHESAQPERASCERGASFGYNTLVADMRSLPIMAALALRWSSMRPFRTAAGRSGRLHGRPA